MAELVSKIIEQEEDTLSGRFLIFKVGDDSYGIELGYVTEIVSVPKITKVPGLPEYLVGIINLRGSIIPVMDIRLRFNMPKIEYNDRTCIIITQIDGMDVGFVVDAVCEVANIPAESIVPPPETSKNKSNFIRGIIKSGDNIYLLIDYQSILKIT
ncbi:MAG TPA: chemotaxis protein CheW [Bacillota bacterium]|nr:purine-binding chemotaxis protein CheW [Clostridiales bacterium]HPT85442.1 chemotaxis protein CheW [Bacillota bacterium]